MSSSLIDLHTHTTYSDGSVNPRELMAIARSKNARAIAVTDHDTVAGIAEAREAADQFGIEFVVGIELSADFSPGTMHILGYCIDEHSAVLIERLDHLRRARENRNPQIATRLQSLGMDIDYDEVAQLAGNQNVGRPHFARLMIEKGYVASIQEAFDRFLKNGAPAYAEKARLSPSDAIELIHSAGGVAVLAHPYQLKIAKSDELDEAILGLMQQGLDGIEAVYSRHTPSQRESYSELASRHCLLVTGGSDFHGSYKPDISIINGLGDLEVTYDLLEAVKSRAARLKRNNGDLAAISS